MRKKKLFFYLSVLLLTLWNAVALASGRSAPKNINERINAVRKKMQEKISRGEPIDNWSTNFSDEITGEWVNWNNWGNWANWNNWNNWANWGNWGNWQNI
jgi:hypothetical protein